MNFIFSEHGRLPEINIFGRLLRRGYESNYLNQNFEIFLQISKLMKATIKRRTNTHGPRLTFNYGQKDSLLVVNKKTIVWRLRNDRYKVHSTIATTKHDKKINIWGYFCPSCVRELYSVDGILLREQYKKN